MIMDVPLAAPCLSGCKMQPLSVFLLSQRQKTKVFKETPTARRDAFGRALDLQSFPPAAFLTRML